MQKAILLLSALAAIAYGQMPTEVECFTNWDSMIGCPAPVITQAYLSYNCAGTYGVFIIGNFFQQGNPPMQNNDQIGPWFNKSATNNWDWLTPEAMCYTTDNDPTDWTGFMAQIRNPDGQWSNGDVTVTNQLNLRPALPSTGSTDPYDPNSCYGQEMTTQQALSHFRPAAVNASLAMVNIMTRSRQCNTATGCAAWGTSTLEASVMANLTIVDSGNQIDLVLGNYNCGQLGNVQPGQVLSNQCLVNGVYYWVHVAADCLMVSADTSTDTASNGDYEETMYGAAVQGFLPRE